MSRRPNLLPISNGNTSLEMLAKDFLELVSYPTLDIALNNLDQLTSNKKLNINDSPELNQLLDKNIPKKLIDILEYLEHEPSYIIIILRILGNIASGTEAFCNSVVYAGGIEIFLKYFHLGRKNENIQLIENVLQFFLK